MPEPTPPGDAGGTPGRRDGPLTPAAIDAALADFRRWLEELAAAETEPPPEPDEPSVDLATLVGAFTALRHEVNLQTKAARAQSDQFARAIEVLQPPAAAADDDAVRPLVKVVAEAYDTLTRAARELDQLRQTVGSDPAGGRTSFFARWLGRPAADQPVAVTEKLGAAVTGLRMSEWRVERLMREVGLEPIEVVGHPFDPEAMEAVEAVEGNGQPSGTVVEELRRGYRWRGRVFRYAQVRVVK
jgi:molecular chaperone GrpE